MQKCSVSFTDKGKLDLQYGKSDTQLTTVA